MEMRAERAGSRCILEVENCKVFENGGNTLYLSVISCG